MEFWKLYRILKRHALLILAAAIVCAVITGFATMRAPSSWKTTSVIRERSAVGDQYALVYPVQMTLADPLLRMGNVQNIVMSNAVWQDVLLKVQSDPDFQEMNYFEESEWGDPVGDVDPDAVRRSRQLAYLRGLAKCSPVPNSDTLEVSVVTHDSADGVRLLSWVIEAASKRYNDISRRYSTIDRVRLETELLPAAKAKRDEARRRMEAFKKQDNVTGDLTIQTQVILQRAAQYRSLYDQAMVDMQQARMKRQAAEKTLKREGVSEQYLEVQTVMSRNPTLNQLNTDLARAQVDLDSQLAIKGERHPDVIAKRAFIAETQAAIERQAAQIMDNQTTGRNPVHDATFQAYVNALVDEQSIAKRAAAFAAPLAEAERQVARLPQQEAKLAEMTLLVNTAEKQYSLLLDKREEALAREQGLQVASLIQMDDILSAEVRKHTKFKMAAAFLLGLLLSASIVLLLGQLDTSVRTADEAQKLLELPIFSAIPLTRGQTVDPEASITPLSAAYQILSTNLWYSLGQMEGKGLIIASAEPNTGRTTTAANLAISLARDGARVLLVDADLRRPDLHNRFAVDNSRGLSDVLTGAIDLEGAVVPTSVDQLVLLPAGSTPQNPVRLLRSEALTHLIARASSHADFVIFDSPSGIAFADVALLAAAARNVLIVQRAGRPSSGAEKEFRTRLERVGARLVGAVLNQVRTSDSRGASAFHRAYRELTASQSKTRALPKPKA